MMPPQIVYLKSELLAKKIKYTTLARHLKANEHTVRRWFFPSHNRRNPSLAMLAKMEHFVASTPSAA